jgi:hypothetical protein
MVMFAGSDITNPPASASYDLTYSAGRPVQDTIIKAVGDDSSAFTYSFGYHGTLPGYATFAITTNFTQGQSVNVYKYDPVTKTYVAIAQGVTVDAGGVVSYVNNSCSDYLITSKTIANAQKSAVLSKQPKRGGSSSFPFATVLIALAAIIIGFAGGFS